MGNVLIKGSFVVLLASVFTNIGNYFYHLAMGRMLTPADYGMLESLISLFYFLGIPTGVLSTIIVKFVSKHSHDQKITSFFIWKINQKLLIFGFLFSIVFLAFFPLIKNLVKINSFFPFLVIAICFFVGNFLTVCNAALQGMLAFMKVGFLSIVNSWSKLIFAVLLVFIGFKVNGAIGAVLISTIISLAFGLKLLRKFVDFKTVGLAESKNVFENIGKYSFSVFLYNLSIISIYTTDIIMARYFLTPVQSGYYAALSVLGKIVFFASNPIVSVMFPAISEKQSRGENYKKILYLSISLVVAISLLVLSIYFLFPDLMIKTLYGEKYLAASGSLFLFGIFISIYSLCNLLMIFFLSIQKLIPVIFSVSVAILQAVLIYFLHKDISQIVTVNIFVCVLLLVSLVVYYLIHDKKTTFVRNRSCL